MSEVKPYKLPEEKTSIVSDSMAVRITPDTDIVTLRHNVMDAVYATTDQNALYSCLVFLSSQKQTLQSSVKKELLNRLDELSKLPDGWDGEGSLALSRNIVDFVKRIILLLQNLKHRSIVLKQAVTILFPSSFRFYTTH
jgi:hypothetical protein